MSVQGVCETLGITDVLRKLLSKGSQALGSVSGCLIGITPGRELCSTGDIARIVFVSGGSFESFGLNYPAHMVNPARDCPPER